MIFLKYCQEISSLVGGMPSPVQEARRVNLCLLFALGVLERTLLQLRDERVFKKDRSVLSSLMAASRRSGLSLKNSNLIDEIAKISSIKLLNLSKTINIEEV